MAEHILLGKREMPMPLNIKNPEVDRLARALAEKTGESITDAVLRSLEERLMRTEDRRGLRNLKDEIDEIGKRCAALPDIDRRSADEILGYNAIGVSD
jgi:antitoxin VapB